MRIEYFNSDKILSAKEITSVSNFLYNELDQYGDPNEFIAKAIYYAMDKSPEKGGLVAVMYDAQQIVGASVINRTGMKDYIPENILVYIAIHHAFRGHGLGKQLLSDLLMQLEGDVALHVEQNNPAIHLYNSLGFEKKYIEMRLIKNK